MANAVQTLAYLQPSELSGGRLTLHTSGGTTDAGRVAHPRFFSGLLTRPEPSAVALLAVVDVARTLPLPRRWLRGFAEVHVIAARFDARAELGPAAATAFLRRLPTQARDDVLWAVPAGGTLRLTSRPAPGAVCVPGPGRLVALRPLLRFATSGAQASSWELDVGLLRLTLTLSPEPARGFSGEGAVLSSLIDDDTETGVDTVAGQMGWQSTIDISALVEATGLTHARVKAALVRLGTAGRVGFPGTDSPVPAHGGRNTRGDRGPCDHALAVEIIRSGM